jgi:hypothetical protein
MTLACPFCESSHFDCDNSPVQFCTACQTHWHQEATAEPNATPYEKQLLALRALDVWDCAMDGSETVSFDLWEVAHVEAESMADLALQVSSAIKNAQSAIDALNDLLGVVAHSAIGQKQLQLPEVKLCRMAPQCSRP